MVCTLAVGEESRGQVRRYYSTPNRLGTVAGVHRLDRTVNFGVLE